MTERRCHNRRRSCRSRQRLARKGLAVLCGGSWLLGELAPRFGVAAGGPNGWENVFFSRWDDGMDAAVEDVDVEQKPEGDIAMAAEGGTITVADVREMEDLVILGAGPAGLTAAIYAARANLRPLVIAKDSGQLASTGEVENYPSCQASPTGESIINSFWQQARTFGARSVIGEVKHVDFSMEPYIAHMVDNTSVRFRGIILATGATSRRMWETPGEVEYYGKGVASCATCEGWFFRGRDVVVVGGGDTAMEEALFLSRICKSVTLVHRRDTFRASKVMIERAQAHPKINIRYNTTVIEFGGDDKKLTHVVLSNSWTEVDEVFETDGAFVAIGQRPNTDMLSGPLQLDDEGYIPTHSGTQTNLEGVFAAGDCADRVYRQAITSAGTGAMAAMDAERYLCQLGC